MISSIDSFKKLRSKAIKTIKMGYNFVREGKSLIECNFSDINLIDIDTYDKQGDDKIP